MPKFRLRALLDVAALLVPDERDRPRRRSVPMPATSACVVRAAAVAVQLDEVVAGSARRSRACTAGPRGGRARPRARSPRPVGSRRDPVELALQPLELAGDARAARAAASPELARGARAAAAARLPGSAQSPLRLRRGEAACRGTGRSSGRGTIASTWPKRRFDSARPKSSGSFSRVVCCDDARAGERRSARPARRRSRRRALAKLASTPAVVGCAITEISAPPASWSSLDRGDGLRQLHQREDPLLHARTARGGDARRAAPPCSAARSHARANFSPTDAPHRAAHEARSPSPRARSGMPLDRPRPPIDRVAETRRHLGLGEPLGVRPEVEELERVGRAQIARPPPRTCPGRRAGRPARARAPGSGGRTAGRPQGARRARRPGSASAQLGHVFGCFPAGSGSGPRCSMETSIRLGHDRPILEAGLSTGRRRRQKRASPATFWGSAARPR